MDDSSDNGDTNSNASGDHHSVTALDALVKEYSKPFCAQGQGDRGNACSCSGEEPIRLVRGNSNGEQGNGPNVACCSGSVSKERSGYHQELSVDVGQAYKQGNHAGYAYITRNGETKFARVACSESDEWLDEPLVDTAHASHDLDNGDGSGCTSTYHSELRKRGYVPVDFYYHGNNGFATVLAYSTNLNREVEICLVSQQEHRKRRTKKHLSRPTTVHSSASLPSMNKANPDQAKNNSSQAQLPRDIAMLQELSHENILKILDSFYYSDNLFVCLERCSDGDLAQLMAGRALCEGVAHRYFKQMMSATDYLHSELIYHRGLQCKSWAVGRNGQLMLKQFKHAKRLSHKFETSSGHLAELAVQHQPPETRHRRYVALPTDIWCLGLSLYEMLTAGSPVIRENKMAPDYPELICLSAGVCRFINGLLCPLPSERLTPKKIRHDEWYNADTQFAIANLASGTQPGQKLHIGGRELRMKRQVEV